MILANLTKAIREQNYYAVVLEFLIVIAGVVIGFQITAWNEVREDHTLEQKYLERLHDDVILAIQSQEANGEWNSRVILSHQVVLSALRSGELAIEDAPLFEWGLVYAGRINPLIWQWGTVEELYATGNISLIQDDALRGQLAISESVYNRYISVFEANMDQIIINRSSLSPYFDILELGYGLDQEIDVAYDFESLSDAPEFRNTYSNITMGAETLWSFTQLHLEGLYRLERVIAEVRNRPPLERPS